MEGNGDKLKMFQVDRPTGGRRKGPLDRHTGRWAEIDEQMNKLNKVNDTSGVLFFTLSLSILRQLHRHLSGKE